MTEFFSKRRLKIAEQIIVVSFFAVLIPMSVSGFIINNINQQSNRAHLRSAAVMIANIVSEEIDVFVQSISSEMAQISATLAFYNSPAQEQQYIDKILKSMPLYNELAIINDKNRLNRYKSYYIKDNNIVYDYKMNDGRYIAAVLDLDDLKKNLFKTLPEDKRQIYVLEGENRELIASSNYTQKGFENCISQLPSKLIEDTPTIFGDVKNKPLVYLKKTKPDAIIIVNTTEALKKRAIDYNRDKIILSILVAMLTIFFVVGLYTSYLYTNIRQLFKAIIAISKGNYERRIRLLTNIFTPFEIVFLGNEFNKMVKQIHKSYIQLKKKNKELKQLNEFRSNMIDTVSHEFRTPLTSIQGYTSRLLRQDIEIDEYTKQKSLKVIKRQSERLRRMIEDLLVIPDIEGARLNVNLASVPINTIIENAIFLVKNDSGKEIINNVENCSTEFIADNDRIEQVFVNLIENAIRYAGEEKTISITTKEEGTWVWAIIKDNGRGIAAEDLPHIFDKFYRGQTREKKGTGLGLYLVKYFVELLGGSIEVQSTLGHGTEFRLRLPNC